MAEPDNLTFIKNVIGLTEIVVPGEDSRNKQLREIQLLLQGAPTVAQGAVGSPGLQLQGLAPGGGKVPASPRQGRDAENAEEAGYTGEPALLPSVPIDELLDDHAVEFEVCRRWANSDAGQTAKAQNPLGFANVRAHAAAHLAALERHSGQ